MSDRCHRDRTSRRRPGDRPAATRLRSSGSSASAGWDTAIAGRVLGGGHDLVVHNRTPGEAGGARARRRARRGERRGGLRGARGRDHDARERRRAARGRARPGRPARVASPAGAIHMTMGTHGVQTRARARRRARGGRADARRRAGARPPGRRRRGAARHRRRRPADAVARCAPLFEVIGRRTFHAGPRPESATAIKLANNLMLGCAIEVMGEAFSLVRKYDVEPARLPRRARRRPLRGPGVRGLRQDHRRRGLRPRRLHRRPRAQGREPRARGGRPRPPAAAERQRLARPPAERDRARRTASSTGRSSRASRPRLEVCPNRARRSAGGVASSRTPPGTGG